MCMFGNKYEEPSDRGKPMKVMHSFEHVINLFTLMKNPLFFLSLNFSSLDYLREWKDKRKWKTNNQEEKGGGGWIASE